MSLEPCVIARLAEVIEDRKQARPPSSYTVELLAGGISVLEEKLREETGELVEAICDAAPRREAVVHEAADVIYHLLVLLAHAEVGWAEIEAELERRFGVSGLAEKAARRRESDC